MKSTKYILLFLILSLTFGCNLNKATQIKKDTTKISIAKTLSELTNKTIDEKIAYYENLKRVSPNVYNFKDEKELNNYGYQLLNKGNTRDAIKIFELLVSEFPNTSNPYDSLGEAYYADKNNELALKNYQKSLELNPKNINAEDWINRIKFPKNDNTKFSKKYTKKEYKNDLDELGRRLTEVNPNAYKFTSKKDFWATIETKKALITDSTTYGEFIWHCSEIIANVNCSHTSMGYFFQENDMLPIELRFPIEVKWINDKLYVSNALINKDLVSEKDEIISINDKNVIDIKNEIYKHISSQGYIETYKKNFFNARSTAIIPYAMGFPKVYKIVIKGKSKSIVLDKLKTYKNDLIDYSIAVCENRLCLNFIENKKIAIMTINNFAYYGDRLSIFQKFIDNSFKTVTEKNINKLIIDVRYNGGGSSDAGIYLLRYLSNKPFKYFSNSQFNEKKETFYPFNNAYKDSVFMLIDGNGNSTTGHFVSMIKKLKLAILVGEELGSNQFCTGGQKNLRLPNTEIGYMVGRNTYETTATSFSVEKGILPDYFVTQSINDYLNNIDTVLKYTIKLID